MNVSKRFTLEEAESEIIRLRAENTKFYDALVYISVLYPELGKEMIRIASEAIQGEKP